MNGKETRGKHAICTIDCKTYFLFTETAGGICFFAWRRMPRTDVVSNAEGVFTKRDEEEDGVREERLLCALTPYEVKKRVSDGVDKGQEDEGEEKGEEEEETTNAEVG